MSIESNLRFLNDQLAEAQSKWRYWKELANVAQKELAEHRSLNAELVQRVDLLRKELAEERRNQRCLKDALRDIASADNGHRCKCQCANNLIEHAQEAIIVSDGNPKVTLTDEQKDRLWSQIKCNLKTREEAENKISATEAERDGADKLALHWKAKFEAAREVAIALATNETGVHVGKPVGEEIDRLITEMAGGKGA